MDFLFLTLTLGSFLMVLPSQVEGQDTVGIEIPPYVAVSSTIKVNCSFQAGMPLLKMVLQKGNLELVVLYNGALNNYTMAETVGVNMVPYVDSTRKTGYFTFAFSQLHCTDFTWYRCRTENDNAQTFYSANKTLQVMPKIERIFRSFTRAPYVREISKFSCTATISKYGSYSGRWYLGPKPSRSELKGGITSITEESQCSRTVMSVVSYVITVFDIPNVTLWCEINAGQSIEKMKTYIIPKLQDSANSMRAAPVPVSIVLSLFLILVCGY